MYIFVNFGGPRSLSEVKPFLEALLTDKDLFRSSLPQPIFRFIANSRVPKVQQAYSVIGGSSPIYADTEAIAESLLEKLGRPICTFHRYLSMTHMESFREIKEYAGEKMTVFPFFPQFSAALVGNVARFFQNHLPQQTCNKFRWVRSYADHGAFIGYFQKKIRQFMQKKDLLEEETLFLFSAHGLPEGYDRYYPQECELSMKKVMEGFPKVRGLLSFQSKFGWGRWLKPYTKDICKEIGLYAEEKKKVLFIPISFTSDQIETLFEVEHLYMPLIEQFGLAPYRLPAFNKDQGWIDAIKEIIATSALSTTEEIACLE